MFVSTTHFAYASLPYCVVFMFSFRVWLCFCVLNLISSSREELKQHTYVHILRRSICVCESKLLRESLFFLFFISLNNFELPLALAHLYPTPPLGYIHHLQLAYTPFVACLIMHFNAQSMTERGCCCCLKRS